MSDIEIARAAKKKPIFEIGETLNIPAADLLPFGQMATNPQPVYSKSHQSQKSASSSPHVQFLCHSQ